MQSFISKLVWLDLTAVVLLLVIFWLYRSISDYWFGDDIGIRMKHWRNEWTKQALWRHERITDVALIRGLIGNVSFFATTTVLVISGLVAILGSSDSIITLLNSYPHMVETSNEAFVLKVSSMLLLAVIAFFKFGWSMRLHGYSMLMMGAAPNPEEKNTEYALDLAQKVSDVSFLASKHFLDGVRAYYLGLSALTWFISAWLFIPMLFLVVIILIRRDYYSASFALSKPIRNA
jgi:uncharacterized membrane protein